MNTKSIAPIILPLLLSGLYPEVAGGEQSRIDVPLEEDAFEHISFGKIPANRHTFGDDELTIEIDSSASFLMLAFDEVKNITTVRFSWQSEGVLKLDDADHEEAKDGDDALFKLGLLLKTDAGWPNPFAPDWLDRVKELLVFPSERMINLVAGAKHAAGVSWLSPYNDRVKLISIESTSTDEGWQQASYKFDRAQRVVAVWLMADGDNTKSSFTTRVRDILLE